MDISEKSEELERESLRRVASEKSLEEIKQYLLDSQKIAHVGSYILNIASGRWNSTLVLDEIFGIDSGYDKNLEGWSHLIHPDWKDVMMDYYMNNVLKKKEEFDKEYEIRRENDGAHRWLHGKGKLLFDSDGIPTTMIGTIRDITEQKLYEEKLKKAKMIAEKACKAKTVFLANMSHEFKTPLNIILGFTQILISDSSLNDGQKDSINSIQSNGKQLLAMINNLLEITRIESELDFFQQDKSDIPKSNEMGQEEMSKILSELPPELYEKLKEAVEVIDFESSAKVIEKINIENEKLATGLSSLLNTYRFDILQKLFLNRVD